MLWYLVSTLRKQSGKEIASSSEQFSPVARRDHGGGEAGVATAQSGLSSPKCRRLGGLESGILACVSRGGHLNRVGTAAMGP